jgi:hypothetical protein
LMTGYKLYDSARRELKHVGGLSTNLIDRHTLSGLGFG